tara:strand:+ start:199 stop:438 length:240 start_codon:yes stop_codon:yes gene_type:complete
MNLLVKPLLLLCACILEFYLLFTSKSAALIFPSIFVLTLFIAMTYFSYQEYKMRKEISALLKKIEQRDAAIKDIEKTFT